MRGKKPEKTSQLREVKKLKGSSQTRRARPAEQATDKTTSQASDASKTVKITQISDTDQAAQVAQTSLNNQADQVVQVAQTSRAARATYNGFADDSRDLATRSASETVTKTKKSTHDLLLECAGQLFAEHGYSGTSIKMIADASNQNIAAVNYHFGTKQNLFICALKHVMSHIMQPVETEADDSKEILAVRLRIFIHDRCMFLLSGKAPAWYGKLIVRAGFEIPFAADQKSIEVFKPDFEFLENLAVRIKKGVDPAKAKRWAYSVVGQIFFYVFGRDMIKIANPDTSFDIRSVNAISEHIYELSLEWLLHEQPPKPLKKSPEGKKPAGQRKPRTKPIAANRI